MRVRLYESTVIWEYGYMRVRLYESTVIWEYDYMRVRLYESTVIWGYGYLRVRLYESTVIWEYGYMRVRLYERKAYLITMCNKLANMKYTFKKKTVTVCQKLGTTAWFKEFVEEESIYKQLHVDIERKTYVKSSHTNKYIYTWEYIIKKTCTPQIRRKLLDLKDLLLREATYKRRQ